MPSVFISYSHDPADLTHAEHVAGLAAALLEGGLEVFFDQNRGEEEEKVPWPIWMDDKIEVADHVLLVCTDLYLKKVRQKVTADVGRGVCWEANIIYALLYESKLNTMKFCPILFSPADRRFIPTPLKGRDCFLVDSQPGYEVLYAFLTGQHRIHFPKQGVALQTIAQKTIKPLFAPPGKAATPARTDSVLAPDKPVLVANAQLTLKPDISPAPRQDIRGLDWYDECDAGHFLGRDDDSDRILAKLLSHPILRLVGPSGIGKSSLIRAGLLPKIREFGWRGCVIRPFEDPAQRIPHQLTAQLLSSPGTFTMPFDPAKFRAEVSGILSNDRINQLVLVLDQFEDIVSPLAPPAAVDAMREFLQELWEQKKAKPSLRAVVVYRTDADARLGRLWQEISGKSEGLPYFALQGLGRSVAEDIINQAAREQGWRLETSVPEIARQLVFESQKLDCSVEVFPVYLQIFLQQAQQNPEGRITAEFITSSGGVSGLIGKYLEQTLKRLKARGGEWEKCGAVLESLSRSTGAKAAQSFNDLIREAGVNRAVLAEMLPVLISERLVRPVGHEIYEIQHDRLAAAVIESLKDSDREAKAAHEFLAAKAPAFERTMVPLTPVELVYLYRHRNKIHPTEREIQVLLASMLHNFEEGARGKSPGAYWFGGSSPQDFLRWFIQIEHWAAKERSSLCPSHEWVKAFPLSGLESQFATFAGDTTPSIRAICAYWIGRTQRDENLPQLRELAKDQDLDVRAAAVQALANFSQTEDLPLLRKLAKDQDLDVRAAAVKALASFSQIEDLQLIREVAKDQEWRVRAAAVQALTSLMKALPLLRLRELAKDQDSDVRTAAVKALASFSQTEDLPLLRELAKDQDLDVRAAAVKALASFSHTEDLPLLRELAKDQDWRVRVTAVQALTNLMKALASFSRTEVLPLLVELAKDQNSDVRTAAVQALASYSQTEDLPLLRELAKDRDWRVRAAAVQTLANFSRAEDLPLLRELAKDRDWRVRVTAVKALASLSRAEDLPLLRELAKDQDLRVRTAAAQALASLSQAEALPLLLELAKNQDSDARGAAVKALANFSRVEALPLLGELALEPDDDVAAEAIRGLASLFSREELEAFLNRHDRKLCAGGLAALDEVLYMPEWMKPQDG
jgi:HEAT repeat protein